MKIRWKAALFKQYVQLFFMGTFVMHNGLHAQMIVTQFRTPLSLSELLHEGLLTVQADIEQIYHSSEKISQNILSSSLQKIEELQNIYDLMNSKSGLHEIHNDERNFLQNLIDRIDQMIQKLEDSSPISDSDDLIRKNVNLLHRLRITLTD